MRFEVAVVGNAGFEAAGEEGEGSAGMGEEEGERWVAVKDAREEHAGYGDRGFDGKASRVGGLADELKLVSTSRARSIHQLTP